MREGKAVFHITAELMKEGGSFKSWKTRWFVVDDTSINYYKDKETWMEGPVAGNPPRPQGNILFSDVLDITCHENSSLCTNINHRPKNATSDCCLHILTKMRTYNVVGFEHYNHCTLWVQRLKLCLRLNNVKRKAKRLLKEQSSEEGFQSTAELESLLDLDVEQALTGAKFLGKLKKEKKSKSKRETASDTEQDGDNSKVDLSFNSASISISWYEESQKRPKSQMVDPVEMAAKGSELTFEGLQAKLEQIKEEDAVQLGKELLKEFEKEGTLMTFLEVMIQQNPKNFIRQACDISDFSVAKLGGLQKISSIIEEFDK